MTVGPEEQWLQNTGEEESEGNQEENDKDKEEEIQEPEMSQKGKW